MNVTDYKFRTELHAHTHPASPCGDFSPEETVKKYAELGFDSLVISNHFYPIMRFRDDKEKCVAEYLKDFDEAEKAGKKYGITVILGCEFRFTENVNDYLLFGIDREFLGIAFDSMPKGLEAFSKTFRSESTLLIQAHPFRDGMTRVSPSFLDGIEVFNMHPGHNSRVALAARFAKEHNLIVTCGSDFHHENHQGTTALLTKTKMQNSGDIVAALKSRDYLIEIGGSVVLPYGAFI